jgi:VWFA-related protein
LLAAHANGVEPNQAVQFPSETALVRISAVVSDSAGNPVLGLTEDDFELLDEGQRVAISTFEPIIVAPPRAMPSDIARPHISSPLVDAPRENRHILILFADTNVQGINSERVRSHLGAFIDDATREGDWITIMSPLAGVHFTARTAFERGQLKAVVRRLAGQLVRSYQPDTSSVSPTDYTAMRIVEYGGQSDSMASGRNAQFSPSQTLLAAETYALARRRINRTLSSLKEAIAALSGLLGPKAIVLYSEGFIRVPGDQSYDNVVALARASHVSVHYVDPRGLVRETAPGVIDGESEGAIYVAHETGGTVSTSNDLAAAPSAILRAANAYYLLGFLPRAGGKGERRLSVRVARAQVKVQAPDRYFLPWAEPPRAGPVPRGESLAVQRELRSVVDSDKVPLRVATLFSWGPKGEVLTTLAVEFDRTATTDRAYTAVVEARPAFGGAVVRTSAVLSAAGEAARVSAAVPLPLGTGLWQCRLALIGDRSQSIGSVLHTFEVAPRDGLRIATPLLSDAIAMKPTPRPRLRVSREYRSTDALYCFLRVFGGQIDPASNGHRINVYFSIQGPRGREVEGIAPAQLSPDGGIVWLRQFDLGRFAAGVYQLHLEVRDEVTGDTVDTEEEFYIVASRPSSLRLSSPREGARQRRSAGAALALPVVLTQYGVSEALYGLEGQGGTNRRP